MINKIDHIIYTAPTLKMGMERIEKLLGVRPVIGGQHPKWGTHNALLSLGDAYLEVVAPDPTLSKPQKGTWIDAFLSKGPQLSSWVLQTDDIQKLSRLAIDSSIDLGEIQQGQRQKPDGTSLNWQLTDPYAMPMGGILPFLIDWGNTPHPSQNRPIVCELTNFILEHPLANEVKQKLGVLIVKIKVQEASSSKLKAIVKSPNGIVTLC